MADQNPSNAQGLMQAPPSGVKVRMYRMGLGDCFLLAFATEDPARPYYVLIDCGSIGAAQNGPSTNDVAEDIKASTGSRIDLLVVSHRHADHISGFSRPAFLGPDKIKVHSLWLPWLENLADASVNAMWKRASQAALGLQTALAHVDPDVSEPIQNVTTFMGDLGAAAAGGDPLAAIKAFVAADQLKYHKPAESPLPLPSSDGSPVPAGVQVYVMGPPKDPRYLYHEDPSQAGETYFSGAGLTADGAFLFGVLGLADDPKDQTTQLAPDDLVSQALSFPFDESLRIGWSEASQDEFFRDHYGLTGARPGQKPPAPAGSQPATPESNDTGDWRTIDTDWLGVAAAVAQALDNVINNTTLPLAIVLPKTGKVLMFVGDAQVGNWQSWHDLLWTTPNGTTIGVADLFKRTVLYKVGHHGSVNATAQSWVDPNTNKEEPWGLPLMTSADLVAMLPVDTAVAKGKKWVMPCATMYTALCDSTQGRIIRVDTGKETPPGGADSSVWQVFADNAVVEHLYDEFTVLDA